MVSSVVASLLQSYLGKYLELSDTIISVGSEIRASDVRIRESAFTELLGLPIKCVHGKVSKLVIKVPWFNLFTKSTIIDIEGVHLLVVPSTSVKYDEKKERKLELEAKQKRLQMAEDAKKIGQESKGDDASTAAGGDSFLERLAVNLIKNLEVTIRKVHIRYEDGQTNSSGYPFAAGITLQSLSMKTTTNTEEGQIKLKIFEKHVVLDSLALYWQPKANLFSNVTKLGSADDVIDLMFDSNIGTVDKPTAKLMYLLGPISSDARLKLCLNPELSDYQMPQVNIGITMHELGLSLSKYQYHDFMLLLQALEYMTRASKFRKYKARHQLENLPNYQGYARQLWKFAFDCVYEEEVMRKINNWSWDHMNEHLTKCKRYRAAYKQKLTSKKLSESLKDELQRYEEDLDEVNIRIQRQLAEREVKKKIEDDKRNQTEAGGGFFGWMWGSKKSSSLADDSTEMSKTVKKLEEALSATEKQQLYEAIDYQENAHHGNFPKSFVARKLDFQLTRLTVVIRDEDLKNSEILKLALAEVLSAIIQRPSADNVKLTMTMRSLTVTGWHTNGKSSPVIVSTRSGLVDDKLLNFEFENNPPSNPDGNLDEDLGCLYDKRLKLFSSPLEIVYDHRTVRQLGSIFKTPEELNLTNLQQTAFAKLKQYREATALTLQYVIDTHHLVDVDIHLMSSYIVLPHSGVFSETCACAVANLGSISVKSNPISAETRSLKDMSLKDLTDAFKSSLRDQVYDKFQVSLENMQVLVSLPNENWRSEIGKRSSPLFLLKPTTIKVLLEYCLITSDPELPLCKIHGKLDKISINIADYRLIKLAQILDSLLEIPPEEERSLHRSESEESMASALSSFANTGSFISGNFLPASSVIIAAPPMTHLSDGPVVQMIQLKLDFKIDKVEFSLSQMKKNSNNDEKIFHFLMMSMKADAKIRTHDLVGNFTMGGIKCSHLIAGVDILETPDMDNNDTSLLSMTLYDVKKTSPDLETVHKSVLKRIDVKFKSVNLTIHQNAIMDLMDKINKLTDEVSSKSRNLAQLNAGNDASKLPRTPDPDKTPKKLSNPRLTAIKTSALLGGPRPVARHRRKTEDSEIVNLLLDAALESATFRFMTTQVNAFATMSVRNLRSTFVQTSNRKEVTAELEQFTILDDAVASNVSVYQKIAENVDIKQSVFDVKVVLHENINLESKSNDPDVVDIIVSAVLGRIRFVFLMKFVNDFLAFLDPFSDAKEMVAEKASDALEGATKTVIGAYVNSTRVKLDVKLEAPLIIIPVHSKSRTMFMADLGTLTLTNSFTLDSGRMFDEMHFTLRELKLTRASVNGSVMSNDIFSQCPIVKPITFELHIRRNMSGSKMKDDPAEISVSGTLYRIEAEISKGDYGVMMAILTENFGEKGAFKTMKAAGTGQANDRSALTLPVKTKYNGSRSSLASTSSLLEAMKSQERDPEVKAVEFSFKLRGLQMEIFTGETLLDTPIGTRPQENSLARIGVELLTVDGYLRVSTAIKAEAFLENVVLDDCRFRETGSAECSNRVVRLMQAKSLKKTERSRMIDIIYTKEPTGDQNIDVTVHSFVLVASISYLLEIANFFVPDQKMSVEWKSDEPDVSDLPEENKLSVFLKIEEPDIFLVENLDDINSDALMFNTELQLKLWSTGNTFSVMATLENIRCHTCCFNPSQREAMTQILRPFTLAFTVSKPDGHGMRINVNIGDLCFNVAPKSIEIIQKSVQALIESMGPEESSDLSSSESIDDFSDLWLTRPFKENQLWFLKPDEVPVEAVETAPDGETGLTTLETGSGGDEQAIININNVVIKVESGIGSNTIPLILLESRFNCDVRDWSGPRMSAIGSMNLEIAYYNAKLALWEPVLEPIVSVQPDGSSITKRWDLMVTVQKNAASDFGSAFVSPSFDEADGFVTPENLPPLMSISLQSRDVLELTVTKSFLSVLTTLNQSFNEIGDDSKREKQETSSAPLVVKNCLGKPVTIILDNRSFKYHVQGQQLGEQTEVRIEHDSEVNLVLFRDRSHKHETEYVSPLQEQTETAEATIRIRVGGERGSFEIPVSKADKRFFPFNFRGDESGDHHGMVSEVSVNNGSKLITFRSIVQMKNHFSSTVNVFSYDGVAKYKKLASVESGSIFNVPLADVYSPPNEFYFQINDAGENMGLESYCWKKLQDRSSFSQQIQCTNTKGRADIFINVDGCKEEIFLERTGSLSSVVYSLDIRPLFVLKNCLPVTLHYVLGNQAQGYIEPGQGGYLHGVRFGHTVLNLKIFEFRSTDWQSEQVLQPEMPDLTNWRFLSAADEAGNQAKLEIGVNATISRGTLVISIYSPFWMVNKTGKMLTYRGSDGQNLIYHPIELESVPMMFSYSTKSFLQKRKASLRVEDSQWSESFTLDTIEDAGKVTCKTNAQKKNSGYNIGVNINMSKSSLTKIITFTPFYMIQNCLQTPAVVWELDSVDQNRDMIEIPAGETIPFWPNFGAEAVVVRVDDATTAPFTMRTAHSTLLMLGNKIGGVYVECRTSSSETMVSLSPYRRGHAPVQLVNHTKHFMIEYSEKDNQGRSFLASGESVYYTWLRPEGTRSLVWSLSGQSEEQTNALLSDDHGVIVVGPNRFMSWVSFLDGMQRVLLFTEDAGLCYSLANTTGQTERIEQEIDISIFGVGLSLVNNSCFGISDGSNYEIVYISISSSDIIWEVRRQGKTRYKPLTQAECQAIEDDYQVYNREKSVCKRTTEDRTIDVFATGQKILVNYGESKMMHPSEGRLRRQFQKGVWLQVRSSVHQRQVHAKINRIQIDNQLTNCLFPVVLAPVPPPKSVVANSIPKPFMELSILEYKSPEHTNIRQFKYVHALVQELHIKIDQGLLNALMEMMEEEEILDENIQEFLNEDLALARKGLADVATLRTSQGRKDFFDFLHLSPLKVHISFSLTSYDSSKKSSASRRSNFLGLFLQSLGVTITDTDDIVFRLAYFERKHTFFTVADLMSDMIRHYSGQAIKQAYVIIFGLDVIGNPYGLVVGVSRSLEDFFYEPFQGAVEGPSEFAEGVVIGVRSVFSGVVGGAAGTVSRITGALGKGLASLTFDEKFQTKRREGIKKRGRQNFGESLARGGKGLVMGIFDGVTGVAMKPIEGAREEGVGGFFKGVGKGVVGLVARPTGGVIDFASGTFDSVKRVTEITEEVHRVRPARFLSQDGVVRYYNLKEATGNKLLNNIEKGRFAESDVYVTHEEIEAERDSVLMISNRRILFLVYQSVLGNWSTEWEFTFAEISGPPPCGKEDGSDKWYIIIKPKEEKRKVFGIFGGGESGKRVFLPCRERARQLARIIEELRTAQKS